ncbi:unnamed protein product, partial [Heterotrigona itama]
AAWLLNRKVVGGSSRLQVRLALNELQWLRSRHRDARSSLSPPGCARFAWRVRSIPAAAKASGPAGSWQRGGSCLCFISVPVSVCTGGRTSQRRSSRAVSPVFASGIADSEFRELSSFDPVRQGMEESYTVHRRRKASARRREKTPDPSSRNQQLVETSDDEEEARRARMEQMAEDAERAELQERERRDRKEEDSQPKVEERKKRSPVKVDEKKSSPQKDSQTRDESDATESTAARSVKKESINKVDNGSETKSGEAVTKYQDAIPRSKDIDGDTDQPVEPRKVERRLKKKSRERIERHGQSSDSSDTEGMEKHPRRTKSPETGKVRVKKSSSKRTSSNVEVGKPREKSSKQKLEGDDAVKASERRRSKVHSQTDDDPNDDDPKVRKSESFPRQTEATEAMKRSASDVKKQIILLSDDSLIEDFARAQEEYLKREKSILDPDTADVFEDAEEETTLRRRKFSVPLTENEQEAIERSIERLKDSESRKTWFSWLPFFGGRKEQDRDAGEQEEKKDEPEEIKPPKQEETTATKSLQVRRSDQPGKVTFMDFLRTMKDVVQEFKAFVAQNPKQAEIVRGLRNRCMSELMLVMIYCGLGAFIFRFTEGAFETFYKCGVKRVKRDFLDSLWNYSHNLREDDWKSMARRKLMEFEEQLHTAHEAGVHTYSGQRSWSFLNAVVYCLTVITTIGERKYSGLASK